MRARVYAIPVAVLLALTLPHLGQGDFRTDTGWYSAIGVSTVRAWGEAGSIGELFSLQAEPGKPFFNKPPLALWIHGIFLRLFGVSLAAARVPTIIAAALCVWMTVDMVRRMGTRSQALMAGMALALTLEFFRRTKEISLDMWQLLFMAAAMWVTVRAVARGGVVTMRNAAASGACIGLALLCKPLVALMASVILGAWLLSRRSGAGAVAKWFLVHIATAMVIAAPWYVVMARTHGDAFLTQHFVGEVADRAAGITTAGPEGKSGGGVEPAWFYVKVIAETYWPWMLTVVGGVIAFGRRELTGRQRTLALVAMVWFAAWLVLISVFPDRRPRYALVLWPAGAMLSGLWFGIRGARFTRPVVRAMAAWGMAAAVTGGAAFAFAPVKVQREPNPQWPALFEWMEKNDARTLWQGGFSGPSGSRLYLRFGEWPIQTQDRKKNIMTRPPRGALLVYHRRDGYAPGPAEEVVFAHGDLTVTRLLGEDWSPMRTPDPGEAE